MKSTKTKFAKKLKSIKAGDYLKQDRILQVLSAADGLVDLLPKITTDSIRKIPWKLEEKPIDVSNLQKEEREASGSFVCDKENLRPLVNQNAEDSRDRKEAKPEISSSSDQGNRRTGFGSEFRRPDSNSNSLFDPKLLEAFEKAVLYYRRLSEIDRETIALEEDDITFPEITDGDRRPEVGRECQGKDCFTLPATTSDCANQEDGKKRAEADEKDKNDLPDSLLTEATVEDKDANMLGQRRPEETVEKDDNALSGISSDIESTAGADEEVEGGRKDDNALSRISGDIESTAGADEEAEGGRKDDNVLSRISSDIESTAGADEEAGGGRKDDNALSRISSDIESTAGAGEEVEGGKKDDNALADPLLGFEVRCPPGGEDSVVLYTTTLRGIRKTFDDCNKVRFLLDSFKVWYYERDVSMHREYREELQRIAAEGTAELPVLFVKGRCVGGANRVLSLHEQGKLKGVFDGVPIAGNKGCEDCGGIRFLMCKNCRGSRKIVWEDGRRIECRKCNENGLIVCSSCSSSSS